MRRREFITVFGAAAAWPFAARAQQTGMKRIGVLMNLAAGDPEGQTRTAAFLQGLQQSGWIDGQNVRIDTRWTAADPERARTYAAELVARAPDVILAGSGSMMPALLQATRTVPIVFVQVPDPVGLGYVASLARPGGNVTGFTQFEFSLAGSAWRHGKSESTPSLTKVFRRRTSHLNFFAKITSAPMSFHFCADGVAVLGTVWIPAAQSKRRSSAGACVDGNWTQLRPLSCSKPCKIVRAWRARAKLPKISSEGSLESKKA